MIQLTLEEMRVLTKPIKWLQSLLPEINLENEPLELKSKLLKIYGKLENKTNKEEMYSQYLIQKILINIESRKNQCIIPKSRRAQYI